MKNNHTPKSNNVPLNQAIHKVIQGKVREADFYLKQGLFSDARQIYVELVNYYRADLDCHPESSHPDRKAIKAHITAFEKKIEAIQGQSDAFERQHKVEGDPGPEKNAAELSQASPVLKAHGGDGEAILPLEPFFQKENVEDGQNLDEIGTDLLAKGHIEKGISTLRLACERMDDLSVDKIPIISKIAAAHEKAGNKKGALAAYCEIIEIDGRFEPALAKIDQLSKESNAPFFSFTTVCTHPWVFLLAALILAAVFAMHNPSVKTVNNVDYFRLENDPDREFHEQMKDVFGNDEFFVIAFEAEPLFSEKYLRLLDQITSEIASLEEVESVTSLANVDDIIGEADYFEVRQFLEDIPDDREMLASLKAQAVNNYLYVKNLLPKDARAAAIVVEAYDRPQDEDYRQRLLAKTDSVLKKYQADVPIFHVGGWTATNVSLSHYLTADMMVFIPATYLLIALATWMFFKNARLTLLAVINISVCLAATRGLLGMTGVTLNNVTSIVIPLVMALSLCDTVHIFAHLDRRILETFSDKKLALAHVLKRVALPCFLTTVTTAIGFLSLSFSDIVPIKEFGWVAAAGMGFEFIFSFFLLPPLLLFFRPQTIYQEYRARKGVNSLIKGLSRIVGQQHRQIATVSCLVVVISLWFASQVQVETNLIEFFKKSSPVRRSLDFVEKRLSGVGTLDVSLQADSIDAFKAPANLRTIERIQQFIDSVEHVDKTISVVDFLKDMNASFHEEDIRYYKIPSSREMVSQYLLVYDADDIEDFVNTDYDHTRISVRISEHSSSGQKEIVDQIKAYIADIDDPSITIRVAGRAVVDTNVIDALVRGQVVSLSTAAVVISLIMFLVFRSAAIACLSMIPNFFPIVLNFGIMGVLGIPLNTGTALIAAVSLGIAVDDTIHFLSEYQRQRARQQPMADALRAATLIKGQAILISSVILCIGFGIMVLSRFVPIIHFGLLSAIIMLTALIGDLIVLPAIMLLKKQPVGEMS